MPRTRLRDQPSRSGTSEPFCTRFVEECKIAGSRLARFDRRVRGLRGTTLFRMTGDWKDLFDTWGRAFRGVPAFLYPRFAIRAIFQRGIEQEIMYLKLLDFAQRIIDHWNEPVLDKRNPLVLVQRSNVGLENLRLGC